MKEEYLIDDKPNDNTTTNTNNNSNMINTGITVNNIDQQPVVDNTTMMPPQTLEINNINESVVTNNINNQNNVGKPKKNKKALIIIIIILILLVVCAVGVKIYLDKKNDINTNEKEEPVEVGPTISLEKELSEPPMSSYYEITDYYFIYKDKIYYYKMALFNGNLYDNFNVVNLDGTNKQTLNSTNELRLAWFYAVYDDYAYYYTMYTMENKKINLKTGEITTLDEKEQYFSNTANNNKIAYLYDFKTFKAVDLTNNKVTFEKKVIQAVGHEQLFYDYSYGNIYYYEDYYTDYLTIFRNDQKAYEFIDLGNKPANIELEFLAANNNYLYINMNNNIYKVDVINHTLVDFVNNELSGAKRISTGNTDYNYLYANGKIYSYDIKTDTFTLIPVDVPAKPEYAYRYGDKIVFTDNTDNPYTSEDTLGHVTIYDLSNKSVEKYDNVRKASLDEKNLYMIFQEKQKFKVQKIALIK